MNKAGTASDHVSARKKRKGPATKTLPTRQSARSRMQGRTRQSSKKK